MDDHMDEHVTNPESQRIRIKNRRKRYLDLHPEYFKDPDLELADPLLYDRLVRRFQTAAEREREGRERGYTGVLEADLYRAEAKMAALRNPEPGCTTVYRRAEDGSIIADEGPEPEVASGEEGWARWVEVMTQRFLRGGDGDFEYGPIDTGDEYDDRGEEEREALEKYLEGEEEEFVGEGSPKGETGIQDY